MFRTVYAKSDTRLQIETILYENDSIISNYPIYKTLDWTRAFSSPVIEDKIFVM